MIDLSLLEAVAVEHEHKVVVVKRLFPAPEVCDRFRCELLRISFPFTACHSPYFISPSKSKNCCIVSLDTSLFSPYRPERTASIG